MSDSFSVPAKQALPHLRGSPVPQKFLHLCPSKQATWNAFVALLTLKHSFATHLPEGGTDRLNIKQLFGHNSPGTTMTYTCMSQKYSSKIQSPLDKL